MFMDLNRANVFSEVMEQLEDHSKVVGKSFYRFFKEIKYDEPLNKTHIKNRLKQQGFDLKTLKDKQNANINKGALP